MAKRNTTAAAVLRRHLNALKLGSGALALAVASSWAVPAIAQETTSSMTGLVLTSQGEPAAGVQVEIVHVPTGTRTVSNVNAEGRFSAPGLRVGGPYTVTFSGTGVPRQAIDGLFIRLGEPAVIDLVLEGQAQAQAGIEEIVVTGERITQQVSGTGRAFNEEQIQRAPTVNRDLKAALRLDPRVSLDPTNVDAISIAGANNRFNQLSVDGVRQGDDFGLNNNGYPTQRAPISLDAIEQLAVVTNPFDVEYSGFQGGLINIVTKSGSNDFSGSAFYYYTDDSITGDKSKNNTYQFTFEEKTYGGTFGGPILRDKLFFFLSYEKLESTVPQDFGPSGSGAPNQVSGITVAEYNQVLDISNRIYRFDAGALGAALPEDDEKILARVDWNITDDHRATFAYQKTEGNQTSDTGNSLSSRTIATLSHLYNRAITLEQYSGQIYSTWTDNFSTELKYGRKEVVTNQDSLRGTDFAEMEVRTAGGGIINVGPDEFRHANVLTNDLNSYKAKGEYLLGDHTITAGFEREELDVFNLFVPRSQGFYTFNSIADFEARRAATFSYQNAVSNNANDGAAQFAYDTNSLYLEDKWNVTPDLELTYGLRYDWWVSDDQPVLNPTFRNRYGFANTETLDGLDLWSPRLGFRYDLTDRTKLTGGVGVFGGGTPNVWISNSFSNDGQTITRQDFSRTSSALPVATVLDNVNGFDIPQAVLTRHGTLVGAGDVNALDPGFEIPSEWQAALGLTHDFDVPGFADGVRLTLDAQFAQTREAVLWQNIRFTRIGTLPDGRPRYGLIPGATGGNDYLLTNTGEGNRMTLSAALDAGWETAFGDIDAYVGYAFQDSEDVNPGTSSTASSNWDNVAVADMNNPEKATSNYEIRHRVTWETSWSKTFFEGFKTTLSFVGEHRTGRPYSFTFRDGGSIFGDSRQDARDRQLFYVPANCNEVILRNVTCADLDAFIERNELGEYRGQIVPRNSHRSPWVHTVDMSLRQEIPAFFKGHRAVLTFDVQNLTNLLNNDWGRLEQVGFPSVAPVTTPSIDAATGRYIYTGLSDPNLTTSARRSVWQIQVGVRYEF